MVVAAAALAVALGGTGYAASRLPSNSVGSQQIKSNAITGRHVQDGSLSKWDFAAGQLPAGAAGPAGPAGPAGRDGIGDIVLLDSGDIAIAPGTFVSGTVTCPAGYYVVGTGSSWAGYFSLVKSYGNFVGYFLDNATTIVTNVSAQAMCATGRYQGSFYSASSVGNSAPGLTPASPNAGNGAASSASGLAHVGSPADQWQRDLARLEAEARHAPAPK